MATARVRAWGRAGRVRRGYQRISLDGIAVARKRAPASALLVRFPSDKSDAIAPLQPLERRHAFVVVAVLHACGRPDRPACTVPASARPAADRAAGHHRAGGHARGSTAAARPERRRARPRPPLPGETTALSTEQSAIAGVPAYTVGNAVTVVTGEELRARQIRHAAEALRSLPGVSVSRSGGFGNLTQVRIRGAEGNHTLVLIDGIEANNTADGEFDFSNLSADDIERIEIIRGPMSGLYGSNAVGGVINIITRRGQGPLTLTVRTEGGSHGHHGRRRRASRSATTRRTCRSSYQVRETDGLQHRPGRQRGRRLAPRHLHDAGGRDAAAGRHARLHGAQERQAGRPRRLRRAGRHARHRHRRPLHARSPGVPGRRQPALGHARRRAHPRAPHQPQRHDHRRYRPLLLPLASAATSARRTSSPTSPPIAWTCRRCG